MIVIFTQIYWLAGLDSAKDLLLHERLPNKKCLSLNNEISSHTAVYNPFSVKLYFRSLYITGKKLFNFLYRPRLLAGTVTSYKPMGNQQNIETVGIRVKS
jgi:hypothetical protein